MSTTNQTPQNNQHKRGDNRKDMRKHQYKDHQEVLTNDENYITLTSHNNQADQINQQQLYKLNAATFTYKAKVENDFPENMYPVEFELNLKEGAQVMFLKNDAVQKR